MIFLKLCNYRDVFQIGKTLLILRQTVVVRVLGVGDIDHFDASVLVV